MTSASSLLAEIQRLYRELRALPCRERPSEARRTHNGSAAYVAIEARIRGLSDRYKALTAVDDQAARVSQPDPPVTVPQRPAVESPDDAVTEAAWQLRTGT